MSLHSSHIESVAPFGRTAPEFVRQYWAAIAVTLIGTLLCAVTPAASDVSWLISLNLKVLAGQVPYVDFIEVNPPASILLYALPIWLAQKSGLYPEFVISVFVFAGAIASVAFSAAVLSRAGLLAGTALANVAALFLFITLVMPSQQFGQREHIALIAFLPSLCVYWLRGSNRTAAPLVAIVAGLGAALMVIIKPHLVFAILFCAAVTAWHMRSIRPIFALEHWVSASLAIAYAVFVALAYPAFINDVVPMVMSVYVPIKAPLLKFLVFFATPIWLTTLLGIYLLVGRRAFSFPFVLLLAASAGMSCSYYLQQKGWAYHAYPMIALGFAALLIAFVTRWPIGAASLEAGDARMKRIGAALGIALLLGGTYSWFTFHMDMRPLVSTIKAAAHKPKVLTISADLGMGHPLTRQVEGTWASRVCALWMTAAAIILKNEGVTGEALARAQSYAARERILLLEDIRNEKPEIILVDRMRFDWLKWANADAEVARELENYRPLGTIIDILILRRK